MHSAHVYNMHVYSLISIRIVIQCKRERNYGNINFEVEQFGSLVEIQITSVVKNLYWKI